MLFALHNRKLGSDYTLAHDRAEDLLTSTVFQLLRYIPIDEGLLPILRHGHPVNCEWQIADADTFEVDLWPHLSRGCCPDVILTLRKGLQVTQRILIEAKLFSGMSYRVEGKESDEKDLVPDAADQIDPNQLIRYWESFHQQCVEDKIEHSIIYLTAHLNPPHKELEASQHNDMRLAWLSWYDVHAVATHIICLPGKDLAEILSDMGFATFNGFRRQGDPHLAFPSGRFFGCTILFASKLCDLPRSGRFWSRS